MTVQPAAFLRTTLPLGIDRLQEYDSGRYHSIWLPDHMVSFWPDSIWTPEFTDLATVSPSPHQQLDGLAVAAAAAVLTERTPIVTSVVDTVRRHPVMLAQTAVTLDHLSGGRFVLGLGSGEFENIEPYGFDFARPVSRFEEAIEVIKLLWDADGPVDFEGDFYRLEAARLDTDLFDGPPPIWIGASGPRMLRITGRHADGWWPMGAWTPEDYAAKLSLVHEAAERAGRDPAAIVTAINQICLIGADDDEIDAMLRTPMVKSVLLLVSAGELAAFGHRHPMGPGWRGVPDLNPVTLSREKMINFCADVDPQAIRDILPCGTPQQVAARMKGFCDAGLQVFKLVDYGGMAGLGYAARSAAKVRAAEDELLALTRVAA